MSKMLEKQNLDQFCKKIMSLYPEEQFDFCIDIDHYELNDEEKYTEDNGKGWYAVKRTKFLDSIILLIGGYGNKTICFDPDDTSYIELTKIVLDFFWMNGPEEFECWIVV